MLYVHCNPWCKYEVCGGLFQTFSCCSGSQVVLTVCICFIFSPSEDYIVIYSNYGRVCLILPGCWKHTRSIVNPHESPMCGSHKGLNTKPVRLHWNTRCVKDSCFAMEEIGLETDHLSVPYASMCHISLSIPMTTAKILVNPSLNRWTMEFVNWLVSGYIAPSCKGKHPIANKLTPVTLWI